MKQLTTIERKVIGHVTTIVKLYESLLRVTLYNPCDKGDNWGFIASYEGMIHRTLSVIKTYCNKSSKIADLGCGISPLLLSLYLLDYKDLNGVDIDKSLLEILKYLSKDIKVQNVSILDDPDINTYDFIYMYMPIKNVKIYQTTVKEVINRMKHGAIIMDLYGPINYCFDKTLLIDLKDNKIFKKI